MKPQLLFCLSLVLSASVTPAVSAQSLPDWVKRIGMSYQGEFWQNGKLVNGSTLFYLSDKTGLTGLYITSNNGNLMTGTLSDCQPQQDRTILCQWSNERDPQTGTFKATFSPDFLSFKGVESIKGDTKEYLWHGERDLAGATIEQYLKPSSETR